MAIVVKLDDVLHDRRMTLTELADRIAVMERGRIIATGSHDELAQSNPLYARLAALQFGAGMARSPQEEVAPAAPAALQ